MTPWLGVVLAVILFSGALFGYDQGVISGERRAWKGFDWDAMDRLHRRGMIADPANKAKSVVLTDEGLRQAEALFQRLFKRTG